MNGAVEQSYNSTMGHGGDSGALSLRLETTKLREDFEMFLKGTIREAYAMEDGSITIKDKRVGDPKANPAGIAAILNKFSLIVNQHVAMGNYYSERKGQSHMYDVQIFNIRRELTNDLILNREDWEIEIYNIESIVDSFMNIVETFLTRAIDNKEREALIPTVKHIENSTIREDASSSPKFFKSGG